MFCALLRHFSLHFGQGKAARAGLEASTIFRISSFMLFTLRRINSIVRLLELIARNVFRMFFGVLVFCFVEFSDGGGIGGLDRMLGRPPEVRQFGF